MITDSSHVLTTMPLGKRHLWIVFVASLGQLLGTAVATLAGIIIPMIEIMRRTGLSSFMQGLIGCIDLVGIAIGSVILGKLSDKYGYLLFFRLCPVIVLVASLVAIFIPNIWVLVVCLFLIGFAIGGEYSLDSNYISVLLPVKWRAEMIGIAKAMSAFGNIIAAAVCFILVNKWREADKWPELMWIIVGVALVMILCRIKFYQSPKWLINHGQPKKALEAAKRFLGNDVVLPAQSDQSNAETVTSMSMFSFIKKYWKKVVLSGVPWACEGLGVYGIGVFLPMLVMALGLQSTSADSSPIMHVVSSIETTFWISCIILPGFILGLILINRKKSLTKIQYVGFYLSAISLIILAFSYHYKWNSWISITAFMLFELFLNMGPHLVTYVLPPKIYPVEVRGQGTGLAASIGKIGAVLAVFFIPVLLRFGGAMSVLAVSATVMFAGGIITHVFGKKVIDTN